LSAAVVFVALAAAVPVRVSAAQNETTARVVDLAIE